MLLSKAFALAKTNYSLRRVAGTTFVSIILVSVSAFALSAKTQQDAKAKQTVALNQELVIPAKYRPLSLLLKEMELDRPLGLSLSKAAPNDCLLVASNGSRVGTIMNQIRLVLSDAEWQYQWSSRRVKDNTEYLLWRESPDPEKKKAIQISALKEQMRQMLEWLHGGEKTWDQLAKTDPDLAESLRQPLFQSRLELANSLALPRLSDLASGREIDIPISTLTSAQQLIAQKAVGRVKSMVTIHSDGTKTVGFNANNLLTNGHIIFNTIPSTKKPGELSLMVNFSTEATDPNSSVKTSIGSDVLNPLQFSEHDREKKSIKEAQAKSVNTALRKVAPGAKTITIDAAMPLDNQEPVLSAYLRSFAKQSGLSLVAIMPTSSELREQRLPRSLVAKPIVYVLNTLCGTYKCEWEQDGSVIRLRPKLRIR